ncbi:MAG TPA: TolC family protein [Bacteroidales bacterium]|nr:TolC family protein [Bacteroidales bacterium]
MKYLIGEILLMCPFILSAQNDSSAWSLNKCIDYALQQNISVQKTALNTETNAAYLEQSKASRFPSLNASASENLRWGRQVSQTGEYGSYKSSNGTSFDVSSSVRLYNGFKIQNTIKQDELSLTSGKLNLETTKESVSLNVLDAYLQVLYAEEQVKNAEKQIESTSEQLKMAEERMKFGAISRSDYLQVKSELASEQLTLANAQKLLTMNKVNLMQLMELPASTNFSIVHPDFTNVTLQLRNPNVDSVFNEALLKKPQIKGAAIDRQIAELDIAIARASYLPTLSLNAKVSTNYDYPGVDFSTQVENRITPSVGLTLSIPIFQNKQAKTSVSIAKIGSKNAELSEINTHNQLRKEIEQACVDVISAEKQYQASLEKYASTEESYNVSLEKYNQGLLNSVDFLIQRTKFIAAESDLIQAKYNLVFSNKTLDFYSGDALTL